MKIKMLSSENGSEDGFTVKTFKKGETYDVSEDLGIVFVETAKVAEVVEDEEPGVEDTIAETPESPKPKRVRRTNAK